MKQKAFFIIFKGLPAAKNCLRPESPPLTEQWRKMVSLLGNTEILSKLHTDVRANELFYHNKCLKAFKNHYKTILNKSKENNTDTALKKAVALEITTVLLKQKVYENSECSIEARGILKIYNSYLRNENLPQESNISPFGEMILYHTKEFEIHKNSHNVNVFILKAHDVKKTSSDQPFDCSMDLNNERWLRLSERPLAVWI